MAETIAYSFIGFIILITFVESIRLRIVYMQQEKRRKLTIEYKKVNQTCSLFAGDDCFPLTKFSLETCLERAKRCLINIHHLKPNEQNSQQLANINARLRSLSEYPDIDYHEVLIPNNDNSVKQLLSNASLLNALLKQEFHLGNITKGEYLNELRSLRFFGLRLRVESYVRHAQKALAAEKFGFACQHYRDAIKLLNSTPEQNEYITTRRAELLESLKYAEDTLTLLLTDSRAYKEKAQEKTQDKYHQEGYTDMDDIDMIFNKKKTYR